MLKNICANSFIRVNENIINGQQKNGLIEHAQ